MTDAVKEITKRLDTLGGYRWDKREIFKDWLELVDASVHEIGAPAREDTEDVQKRLLEKYGDHEFGRLVEAMNALVSGTTEDGEPTYRDMLGPVFMEVGQPGSGQFFTPREICRMMAAMQADGMKALAHERLKTAIETSPMASAALITSTMMEPEEAHAWFFERILPAAMEHYDPITVLDPAVGSGSMLLAVAEQFPPWMVQCGLVRFYGQDIDQLCVTMSRINCKLYGLR